MSGLPILRVFGLDFASEFQFRAPLQPGLEARLRFAEGSELEDPQAVGYSLIYTSRLTDAEGRSVFELWQNGDDQLLRFVGRADFHFEPTTIRFWAGGALATYEIENLFLSAVLAYYLELRGVIALHGSAVETAGEAIAFLADSGCGKSSLAAACVLAGQRLVSDDVLALELTTEGARIRPAYPQIKLNADVGRALLGERFTQLERFDPRAEKRCWSPVADGHDFCQEPPRLRALYVLARGGPGDETPSVEHMTARDALVELLRAGFTPSLVEGVGLAESRLNRLSELVGGVRVFRLVVPGGIEHLGATAEAIARLAC